MFNNLLNIRKHSSALARLIATVQLKEHGVECYFDQASEAINMRASRSEVLEALDKDISKTADVLFSGQSIINSIKDGRVREFDSIYNTVDDVFGLAFDRYENTIALSGVVFNIGQATAYTKAQLKEMILKGIFGIERSELSGVLKTLVRYEETQDEYEKAILYPSTILADKIISKVVQQDMAFSSVRRGMTHEEKSAFDTTFSRTGIDGVIQNSTFISVKGVEQLAPAHKISDTKELDFLLSAGRLKYIEAVEIDGDGDVAKMEKLVKQIEQLKLNASFKFTLKARKLGNYSARGLFMQSQLIVAEDVRDTTAILHEIGHLIHLVDFSQDNFVNYLISKLTPMVKVPEELASKTAYYLEPTEVVARACEIAGLFAKEAGDETLNNDEGFALIKSRAFYEAFSGIYFDFNEFDETTKQELLALYELFYGTKNGSARPANIDNFIKIDTHFKRVEKEKNYRDFLGERMAKKEKELRALYSLVNSSTIDQIFSNRKTALCDVLGMKILANISFCGNHTARMTVPDWAVVIEDKSAVIMYIIQYLQNSLTPKEWVMFLVQMNKTGAWSRVKSSVLLGGFQDKFASLLRKELVNNEALFYAQVKEFRQTVMMKSPVSLIDADMIQDEEFVLKVLDIIPDSITAINADLVSLDTLVKWNKYVLGKYEDFKNWMIHPALVDSFEFMDECIALDFKTITRAGELYRNDFKRMRAFYEKNGCEEHLFYLGDKLKDDVEFARPIIEIKDSYIQHFTQRVKEELAKAGDVDLVEVEIKKLKTANTSYRRKAVRATTDLRILECLAKDRNNEIRAEVAKRDIATAEMLTNLAKLKDVWVRTAVAGNENTPKSILLTLLSKATEEDERNVINAIAQNPKLSLKELNTLLKNNKKMRYTQWNILLNPNILNFNHEDNIDLFREVVYGCLKDDAEFFYYEMRVNSEFRPSKELIEDILSNLHSYIPSSGYQKEIQELLVSILQNAPTAIKITTSEKEIVTKPKAKKEEKIKNDESQDFEALLEVSEVVDFERTDNNETVKVLRIAEKLDDFKAFNQWMRASKKGYYSSIARGFILYEEFAKTLLENGSKVAAVSAMLYSADMLDTFAKGVLF